MGSAGALLGVCTFVPFLPLVSVCVCLCVCVCARACVCVKIMYVGGNIFK